MKVLVIFTNSLSKQIQQSSMLRSLADQILTQTSASSMKVIGPRSAESFFSNSQLPYISYDHFDFEKSFNIWGQFKNTSFDMVVVCGTLEIFDYQEIISACYLTAESKIYYSNQGRQVNLKKWEKYVVLDHNKAPVRIFGADVKSEDQYIKTVNKWASDVLVNSNYRINNKKGSRDANLEHYIVNSYLGLDLSMQTPDLHSDQWGVSWSYFMMLNQGLVQTPDYHRSLANFIMDIPGISSVLDVGCGSGFVDFYLSSDSRIKKIVGVDGANSRVGSANFFAELNSCNISFDTMQMDKLLFSDKSFDLTVTCAALEQAGSFLPDAIREISRVTRKVAILVEPSIEFYPTFPGQINVQTHGWAQDYTPLLYELNLPFAIRPNLFSHYYNPTSMIVINFEDKIFPSQKYPGLFNLNSDKWPGGIVNGLP